MYILFEFPDSQNFQELEGFEENSHVCVDEGGAFFISVEWLLKVMGKVEFSSLMKERIKSSMLFEQKEQESINREWNQAIPFEGGMSAMEALIHITTIE